ncbi:MAG TPA: adventurous gliding motility lipoprotein CglC [Archangium sp.]|jgi:hypothetical protein|uniref:adventurous gliding motility lipoprotein CglC n=1 Tax=Archangium sp. TaxID=1872627 RepID=UPI002EDAE5C2
MSSRLALLVSAALLCGGCKVTSDIGKPCLLVKRGTGSNSAPVTEADLRPGQDFISFGALDCEDLVCVKDANMPTQIADNEAKQVIGYCSKACVAETQDTCAVTDAEALAEVKDRIACRPLLLDQQALDALRAADRAAYRATFGDNTSPYFCASAAPTTP